MFDTLTGRTEDHLAAFRKSSCLFHPDVLGSLEAFFQKAQDNGFDLQIASSYRSYERQCLIWNEKVSGKRPVFDQDGYAVDVSSFAPKELIFKILRWSALPGASRHHWGTDFDFYDLSSMAKGYQVRLALAEYEDDGVFALASNWVGQNMSAYGFERPYAIDRGGVSPEPWHLSYTPLAKIFEQEYTFELFEEHLAISDFALVDLVRANAKVIYDRFVSLG